MDPLARAVLCGNLVATCTQDRHLWIWIYPWISTLKSVDMYMDMDGKFHIHGKPASSEHFTYMATRQLSGDTIVNDLGHISKSLDCFTSNFSKTVCDTAKVTIGN